MRFSFYTSVGVAALLAVQTSVTYAIELDTGEEHNPTLLAQLQTWGLGEEQDLAQIYQEDGGEYDAQELAETKVERYYSSSQSQSEQEYAQQQSEDQYSQSQSQSDQDYAQTDSRSENESESRSESGSESYSQSESESRSESDTESKADTGSDSDVQFPLELAQKVQELKMLNAVGTINAAQMAQVQQIQQMQAMGMGMPGPQQMGAAGGAGVMGFAQINAEEDNGSENRLAQIAKAILAMPDDQIDQLESILAQVDHDESNNGELDLAQVSSHVIDEAKRMAVVLEALDGSDLAQIANLMEAEDNKLSQVDEEPLADDSPTVLVEIGTENMSQAEVDAEAFSAVAEYLSQIETAEADSLVKALAQVRNRDVLSLAQTGLDLGLSMDDDLNEVADFLAQLDNVELAKLNNLVEIKSIETKSEVNDILAQLQTSYEASLF